MLTLVENGQKVSNNQVNFEIQAIIIKRGPSNKIKQVWRASLDHVTKILLGKIATSVASFYWLMILYNSIGRNLQNGAKQNNSKSATKVHRKKNPGGQNRRLLKTE